MIRPGQCASAWDELANTEMTWSARLGRSVRGRRNGSGRRTPTRGARAKTTNRRDRTTFGPFRPRYSCGSRGEVPSRLPFLARDLGGAGRATGKCLAPPHPTALGISTKAVALLPGQLPNHGHAARALMSETRATLVDPAMKVSIRGDNATERQSRSYGVQPRIACPHSWVLIYQLRERECSWGLARVWTGVDTHARTRTLTRCSARQVSASGPRRSRTPRRAVPARSPGSDAVSAVSLTCCG